MTETQNIAEDRTEKETCDAKGCESDAIARVLPTHGKTDHSALRCRDCLRRDLDDDWYQQWRDQIEETERVYESITSEADE